MRVLIPLPTYGFDPTEVAIPWQLLSEQGIDVVFMTPDGKPGAADRLMLTGERLGVFRPLLRARQDAVVAHDAMTKAAAFCEPLQYSAAGHEKFDALFLPGGHDKGVKTYLESVAVQHLVVDFFAADKPVAAICHGVVVAARSTDPGTGKSVIHDFKTTALLKSQEMAAYNLTRLWLNDYYLTYPGTTVEDEVKAVLSDGKNFVPGPTPVLRDSMRHPERGFVVRDRNYLSARWPGDVYRLSLDLLEMLAAR